MSHVLQTSLWRRTQGTAWGAMAVMLPPLLNLSASYAAVSVRWESQSLRPKEAKTHCPITAGCQQLFSSLSLVV